MFELFLFFLLLTWFLSLCFHSRWNWIHTSHQVLNRVFLGQVAGCIVVEIRSFRSLRGRWERPCFSNCQLMKENWIWYFWTTATPNHGMPIQMPVALGQQGHYLLLLVASLNLHRESKYFSVAFLCGSVKQLNLVFFRLQRLWFFNRRGSGHTDACSTLWQSESPECDEGVWAACSVCPDVCWMPSATRRLGRTHQQVIQYLYILYSWTTRQ